MLSKIYSKKPLTLYKRFFTLLSNSTDQILRDSIRNNSFCYTRVLNFKLDRIMWTEFLIVINNSMVDKGCRNKGMVLVVDKVDRTV